MSRLRWVFVAVGVAILVGASFLLNPSGIGFPSRPSPSPGDKANASPIAISGAWARASVGAAAAGAAYVTIRNRGTGDDALVGAHSPVSASVEIHEMDMSGSMMRMRAIPRLVIPAGQTISLAPGGNHIMLVGLKAPLKAGSKITLSLHFERAGAVSVQADVQ